MSQNRQESSAGGHSANQRQSNQPDSPPEERHQPTREHVPTDLRRQSAGLPPEGSTSTPGPAEGHSADQELEERIRRRAYQIWDEGGRQEGQAEDHWHRAAQDLDREDADLQRAGSAGKDVNRT
ncbi:MAG TPA: DUF2934 domain-containing protein [Hyphomicrobiaceae bacterium]|nr:DUF2934 domain-containing protein [Hyphomicrobiaceae bacterium]